MCTCEVDTIICAIYITETTRNIYICKSCRFCDGKRTVLTYNTLILLHHHLAKYNEIHPVIEDIYQFLYQEKN